MTINPHRITIALDRAKLFGPSADAKLDAVEPDLDNWEAGRSRPSESQLAKLGRLANLPREFFDLPDDAHPRITVVRVCNRRKSTLVISMHGEVNMYEQTALDLP